MLQRKPASMEARTWMGCDYLGWLRQHGRAGPSWAPVATRGAQVAEARECCHSPFLCLALLCWLRDMRMELWRSCHPVICDGSAGKSKGLSGILNFLVEWYWQFLVKVSSLLPFYEFFSLAQALLVGWGWRYLLASEHFTLHLGSLAAATRGRETMAQNLTGIFLV